MADYRSLYEKSLALVVGINSYTHPRFATLGEAEADAQAVAGLLSAAPYDFQVRTLLGEQATKQAVLDGLFELRATESDDRLLVYFAGHGYTLTDRFGKETGYLACFDTVPDRDYTALELDDVTALRRHAGAKHAAFIFDACFSGQALGLTRAQSIAADKYLLRRAYQVISAGAGDQTVSDFRSMTDLLLEALKSGVSGPSGLVTLSALAVHVREAMAAESGQTQIPQFGHLQASQGGEFIFFVPPEPAPLEMLPRRLGRGLTSYDPDTRYFAIESAERLLDSPKHAAAVQQVLEEMVTDDPEPEVRRRALDALRKAPSAESKPAPPEPGPVPVGVPPEVRPAPEEAEVAEVSCLGPVPSGARVRLGRGDIEAMALSPDGAYLAVGTPVGVYLYRADTFDEVWFGATPFRWTNILRFSPGGQALAVAAGGNDERICLLEVASGQVQATLEHEWDVVNAAWSPDGTKLAASDEGGRVTVWDARQQRELLTLAGEHTDQSRAVAWSPDGLSLVSGDDDGLVLVWDAATGEVIYRLAEPDGKSPVYGVLWSPDRAHIAARVGYTTVVVWDARWGRRVRTLEDNRSVTFSPNGSRIACKGKGSTISVSQIDDAKPLYSLDNAFRAVWSPDGTRLAVEGSENDDVTLHDAATGETLCTLEDASDMGIMWFPDSAALLTRRSHRIYAWDAETGQCLRTLTSHLRSGRFASWSPDGTRLAAGSAYLAVWDAERHVLLDVMWNVGDHVMWSPDGETFALTGGENVFIRDASTGALIHTLEGHKKSVYSVAWSPDGSRLASGAYDQNVVIWDTGDGVRLATLEGHDGAVFSVAWSPDGQVLASGSWDKTIAIWDARTGERLRTLEANTTIYCLAWSPDGTRLTSGHSDGSVLVWDVRTGGQVYRLEGHESTVYAVAPSPDGTRLTSGDDSGLVIEWDMASGETLRRLEGHVAKVRVLAFSPDGSRLASASEDGTTVIW